MGKKATDIEIQRRKEIIMTMVLDCETKSSIVRYSAETWGYSERRVESLLQDINKDFEKQYNENFKEKYTRARLRTERFYRKMLKLNQHNAAVSALKELNDIEGIKKVLIEHGGTVGQTIKIEISKEEENL